MLGSQKEMYQSLQNWFEEIVGFAKKQKRGTIVTKFASNFFLGSQKERYKSLPKFFLASFGLMPVDPEAGATSSKLTCQCITPLCNAMILKILRCVDWWLTHSCLLDVELLANTMPTEVCVSAQLWMRPHVVHHQAEKGNESSIPKELDEAN